jgi:hypothetical protein
VSFDPETFNPETTVEWHQLSDPEVVQINTGACSQNAIEDVNISIHQTWHNLIYSTVIHTYISEPFGRSPTQCYMDQNQLKKKKVKEYNKSFMQLLDGL